VVESMKGEGRERERERERGQARQVPLKGTYIHLVSRCRISVIKARKKKVAGICERHGRHESINIALGEERNGVRT